MKQGPLPLILLAAREYPTPSFREKLWGILENWVSEKSPRFCQEEVNSLIDQQKGTFVEPFVVTGEDRRLAVFLLRLALSEEINAARFRVVSEDTVGNWGGAVFTRRGNSFYSERFVLGKNKLRNSCSQFFAPSMKVSLPCRRVDRRLPTAFMKATSDGISIHVDSHLFADLDWITETETSQLKALAKGLTQDTVIGDNSTPIGELGLSIQASDRGVAIISKSPESLIRLSAHIVQGSSIVLRGCGNYEFVIQIPTTGEGEASCLITANDGFAREWMDVAGFGSPEMEIDDIVKISEWAMPHNSWADQVIERGI